MKRAKKGFTLVEVIIVLVIIAIVAAIAVPNISGYIKRSKANNCQHTMNDFVNDLEYKIVSKRYYDVSELNDELIKLVDSYADSYEPPTSNPQNGKFTSLTTELKKVTGICPNGGQYTVEWTIKPGDDPNTAKVKIGKCECDCIDEHVQLTSSYELTAALIDTSEYLKSDRSAVNIYETDIQKIIRYIDDKLENGNPSNIAEVVNNYKTENPESKYDIKGVTVKEQRDGNPDKSKWVEWICVDLNKNNDPDFDPNDKNAHDFIVYYPDEKNEATVSDAAVDAVGVPSDKKLVVMPFSENMASHNDYWPPAEGTSGSYLYSEKLPYTTGQIYQVAGVDHPDRISWIQREEKWYVEKTDSSKGIDDLGNSRPDNPEEHVLLSRKELDSISVSSLLDSETPPSDSRNMLLVNASYKNETGVTSFSHMEASDDGSTIRNGYVILSSKEEYIDKTWAGIYADSTSPEAAAELNTRKEILGKEEALVRDFFSGVTDKLVVAYQEYNKVYNKTADRYEVMPVTCFGEITMSPGENGVKEIKIGNDVVATVEAAPGKTSDYDVYFDQAVVSGDTFRVEDLSIKRSAEYLIKNTKGDVVGKSVVSENIPHASKAAAGEVGFFVSEKWTDQGYIPEDEDDSVLHINRGMGQGFIFLTDDSMTYQTIGHIHTYENGGYLNWSYEKEENDTEFDIDKLKATVSYKVNVENKSGMSVGEGVISYNYVHKTDDNSYGFYLVDKNTYEQGTSLWNQATDSKLCSELNGRYSAARVMIDYYKYEGNNQRNVTSHLCDIVNYFDSVTANYKNDGKGFNFNNITAEANYRIELFHYAGQSPVCTINHQEKLDHESGSKFRYYITMQQYYDPSLWTLQNEELAYLGVLYGGYSDDKYVAVAYNDGDIWGNSVTRRAPLYINCASDINPPEIVYIPFDGTQDAYAIAYTGSGKDITVEPSYEGYWSETSPDSSVSSGVVKVTAGGKDYYYIDDQKTYNITRIGNAPSGNDERQFAFPNTSGIIRMEIKNGIEEIGPGAFKKENSDYFKKDEAVIILSDSVNAIGKNAFSGLKIGNIVLGNITKNITDGTVTSASSDNSRLLSIGAGAFSGTTLSKCDAFVVPEQVASMGVGAFSNFKIGNGGLFIDGVSNASDNSISNNLFNGTVFGRLKFGTRVEKIEPEAFKANTSSAVLDLGSVKSIGGDAFSGWVNARGDLVIPESVTSIKDFAFSDYASNSQLDNYPVLTVNGGSSQTDDGTVHLGSMIFTNGHFRNISIGGNVEEIDDKAFDNTTLKGTNPYKEFRGNLKISGVVSKIGKNAFKDCSGFDGELTLPDSGSLRTIDNSAFSGCFRFTGGLTIPDGTETIGSEAFANCLGFNGNLVLPNALSGRMGLLEIGDEAFVNCQGINGNLTIPDTVQRIGISTFEGCTGFNGSIKLSSTLKKIGAEAFKNCTHLKGGLIIPETVTESIGSYAFENFASEVSDSEAGKLVIGSGSYEGKTLGAYIFDGSKFNDIYIGGIVENIGKSAFQHGVDPDLDTGENEQGRVADYSKIKGTLTIGESVKVVDNLAFKGMGVNALDGMSNVQRIGDYAFWKCDKIASDVNFGGQLNLASIGKKAFYGDNSINNLSIPRSVTTIGNKAFEGSGNGEGRLVIYGSSGTDSKGHRILGNEDIGSADSIFNHARYRNVDIGGNVEVIGYRFMKTYSPGNYDYTYITGDLTISGNVREIKGEAFNEGQKPEEDQLSDNSDAYKGPGFNGTLKFTGTELETIGYSAFENLIHMKGDLTIPENVHNIDRRAFKKFAYETSEGDLGKLSIKGYSETYGDQKIIGYRLFSYAKFSEVEIGGADSSVNTIGNYAFFNCTDTQAEKGADGKPLIEDEQHTFKSLSGYPAEAYKVHRKIDYDDDQLELNNDTSNYAEFTKKLTILEGVETIGYRAFGDSYSAIQQVDLSQASSLKTIYDDAFNRCTNAGGGLTIPKSVEYIGRCAFKQFGSDSDNPGQLTILGCSEVKGDLRYIGHPDAADSDPIFPSAKFNNVVIGGEAEYASVNAIAKDFMNNQLKTLEPYKNDSGTYDYSKIKGSLTIGSSIKQVGDTAFLCMDSFNGALNLNNGLEKIGESAFNACPWFKGDLLIPQTVNSIGTEAFKHFGQDSKNTGSLTIRGYSSIKPAPDGSSSRPLQTIDSLIFSHAHFTNVTIGGNVEYIGENFMENETTETFNDMPVTRYNGVRGNLTIGEGVYRVGKNAFLKCKNFDGALKIADSVWQIGESAFNGCSGLYTRSDIDPDDRKLVISSHVTQIGSYAFKSLGESLGNERNNRFPSLEIYGASGGESNMKSIGGTGAGGNNIYSIFSNARFNNVTIGGEVRMIGDGFMKHVQNGDSNNNYSYIYGNLIINDNTVQSIGSSAFENVKFDNVRIGKGITQIKNGAFTSAGTGNGLLEIYSGTDINNSNMIGKNDVFKNAKFNGVTIGGDVRYIDGTAFMSSDFSGLKGTLTLLPKSVGYIDGSYQLVQSKSNGVYVGGGMQFSAPSLLSQFFRGTSKYGPFWGCDFNKAVFPEELYDSFDKYIYYSVPFVGDIRSNSKYYEGLFNNNITFQKY
ncbi:MAG: leucine-rich repeat protein [Oscillospiraceae bacterium]|nr:leucine-rich repeat protein [Oscillospiraceae bacterium]